MTASTSTVGSISSLRIRARGDAVAWSGTRGGLESGRDVVGFPFLNAKLTPVVLSSVVGNGETPTWRPDSQRERDKEAEVESQSTTISAEVPVAEAEQPGRRTVAAFYLQDYVRAPWRLAVVNPIVEVKL